LLFWKYDPLGQNFQNSVLKVFTATLIDVVAFKFREIWRMGNSQNLALFTGQKKTFHLPLKLRRSHPKSARASPQQCTLSAPDFIPIG